MIKYDIYAFISYDHNGPYAEWEMHAADEGAGRFVLAADALAEIERLRGLVESAFREGADQVLISSEEDENLCWNTSRAKKALEAKP